MLLCLQINIHGSTHKLTNYSICVIKDLIKELLIKMGSLEHLIENNCDLRHRTWALCLMFQVI